MEHFKHEIKRIMSMNYVVIGEIGRLIQRLIDLNEYVGESLEIKEGQDFRVVMDSIQQLNFDLGMLVGNLLVFRKESDKDERTYYS
jgi:hypothetical protein